MISVQEVDAGLPGPHAAALGSFYTHMALGLHAAAQPLTILLASLGSSNADRKAGELRNLVASSGIEVERVCVLFHYLQQLLEAESVPTQILLTPVLPLVEDVSEGVKLLFEQEGIRLRLTLPTSCRAFPLDRGRVMQALSNVLLVAYRVSRKGDTVELILSSTSEQAVNIVVQHADARRQSNDLEPEAVEVRLSMAVAEANIRCQEGTCSWSLKPFRVEIQLQQPNRGRRR